MKSFVLFFGDISQPLDPLRHLVGEFDTVPEAQLAAEGLEQHHRGNWAYICRGSAQSVVRAGLHHGASGHYWWEWEEEGTADLDQAAASA